MDEIVTIPEQVPADLAITTRHQTRIRSWGATVEAALAAGARSVTSPAELPVGIPDEAAPGLAIGRGASDVAVIADDGGIHTPDQRAVLLLLTDGGVQPERALVCFSISDGLAAATHAPAGWVVVAAPTPDGWRDAAGPAPALTALARRGLPTVLVGTADPRRDRATWDRLSAVGELLRLGGAEVTWVAPPAGMALSELLADPGADSPGVLTRLVAGATAKLGRAPAAPRPRGGPAIANVAEIDDEYGCVRGPRWMDDQGRDRPGQVILSGMAPRIATTEILRDDAYPADSPEGAPSVSHHLVVTLGDGTELPVLGGAIPDAGLAQTRQWLANVEGGAGTFAGVDTHPATPYLIAEALRAHRQSERQIVHARPRTGWFDDPAQPHPVYLFRGGAMGVDGIVHSSVGRIGLPFGWEPSDLESDPQQALRTLFGVAGHLGRPELFAMLMGIITYALAGPAPVGSLLFIGDQSAGKTSLVQAAISTCGKGLVNGMYSAHGTQNAVASLGEGMHQAPVLIDDVVRVKTQHQAEQLAAAIDLALRRGYQGGQAGRERLAKDLASGRFGRAAKDLSRPQIIISADEVPELIVESGLDRAVIVPVRSQEDTWAPGAWQGAVKPLAVDGVLQAAGAHLIRELARMQADAGGQAQWLRWLSSPDMCPSQMPEEWAAGHARDREVIRPFEQGLALLTLAAERLGVPELGGLLGVAQDAITTLVEARTESRPDPAREIIERCKSLVASGKAAALLSSPDEEPPPNVPILGRRMTITDPRGEEMPVVALLAYQVADLTKLPPKRLSRYFASLAVKSRRNEVTRAQRMRSGDDPAPCYCIPLDVWGDSADGEVATRPLKAIPAPPAYDPDDFPPFEEEEAS